VYGLGADATNDNAVARIFAAKDRPQFNPLIAHLPDAEAAFALVATNEQARRLAERFWPGPLTLVLPRADGCRVSLLATAGLDTLAVRVPDHPVALALLRAAACPIAAPSANRSGHVSPTTAAHVAESLDGAPDIILDGGACPVGLESTVIDLSGPRPALLRPGGVATEDIEKLIGRIAAATADDSPRAPGMLARHYAPHRPLRTGATSVRDDEAVLAFGPRPLTGAVLTRNLSVTGDVIEAAANLFAMLRELDRADVTGIAAMPVPETGLGRAINDRLRRAAHR
jgi:L-threonylcarbamoyladenylate synthase